MYSKIFIILLALLTERCSFSEYRNYSVANGVSLAVIRQEGDKLLLKLRNDRTTTIFFNYSYDKISNSSDVAYGLVCYKENVETDFGPVYDYGMPLVPLEPGSEIEFTTSRSLPSSTLNCYVSVGYYNNVKAVELVKKLASNPSEYLVAEDENTFLTQSAEQVLVALNIN